MLARARALAAIGGALVATIAVAPAGTSSAASAFPCVFHWSLMDGYPAGYVVAGSNASCPPSTDSLTLRIRLLVRKGARWATMRVKQKTWRSAPGSHALEIRRPCKLEQVRGIFRWTLRSQGRALVARHVVRSGVLKVTPACKFVLGASRASG